MLLYRPARERHACLFEPLEKVVLQALIAGERAKRLLLLPVLEKRPVRMLLGRDGVEGFDFNLTHGFMLFMRQLSKWAFLPLL